MGARTLSARAKYGDTMRRHRDNPDRVIAARRDLAEAKIADYIERVVREAPPLSAEQCSKLAILLLRGGDAA